MSITTAGHRSPHRHLDRRPRPLARRLPGQAPGNRDRPRSVQRVRGPADGRRGWQLSARGSVKTASVDTNESRRDDHLRSADFFSVDEHPELTFVSTRITPQGEDEFEIVGELTLHGVTKEIVLQAEVQGTETDPWGNERVGVEVNGQLSRGEYGMTFNQALGSGNVAGLGQGQAVARRLRRQAGGVATA